VIAEVFYIVYSPLVLPDGAIRVVTDRDYFDKSYQLLSGARESIHIVMFSANYQTDPRYKDSRVNKLLDLLVSAKNRGLDVRVIMDDFPEGNEDTAGRLRKNNIDARIMRFDGSTHDKLIIVDGRIVIVGSTNWSYYSIDMNHEANVVINNERVANEFEGYFSLLWGQT
jgi:phosphatidylserine/phosphatidylglycerophosphate/cardiolipin synthase-like enzyme